MSNGRVGRKRETEKERNAQRRAKEGGQGAEESEALQLVDTEAKGLNSPRRLATTFQRLSIRSRSDVYGA